jgi:hypothetical protein
MCGKVDLGCQLREGLQGVVTDQFEELARRVGELASSGLQAVATFWIKVDSPTVATQTTGHGWHESAPVDFLHSHVLDLSISIVTVAMLIAAMRLAWEQRAEPLRELGKSLFLLVLVTGAGSATVQLLAGWSDAFAVELVNQAKPSGQEFHEALGGLVLRSVAGGPVAEGLPTLAVMFFGVAVFIAAVIQVILLLIRSAMLVLLAGLFPLAAAATNTDMGKAWFKKYCAWSLAFIAYKPAAALVFAAAMKMTEAGMGDKSGNGLVDALAGLMMMLLAVFALPALLRFAVPVAAAVAGGGAGMGGGAADPGGLATGAISVGRSATGGRSSNGGGNGGGGSSGSGSSATGALGVGANAGLGVAAAAVNGARKAGDALAGAAAHSGGEAGGGSSGSASGRTASGGGRGGSRRGGPSASRREPLPPRTSESTGPGGSA